MTKTALIAAAALALAAPAAAHADTYCGGTKISGNLDVQVGKRGVVTCAHARAITRAAYNPRVRKVQHCTDGRRWPRCDHAHSYFTVRPWPGWRFWTGPGGGGAWRPISGRVTFDYTAEF